MVRFSKSLVAALAVSTGCSAFTAPRTLPFSGLKSSAFPKPTAVVRPASSVADGASSAPQKMESTVTFSSPSSIELSNISIMRTPAAAFQVVAEKGKFKGDRSLLKNFVSALLGGCYVGMGAMVALAISGNIPGIASANPGVAKLFFAALFPVKLLLCLQAGGQLFTGNTAYMAAALCEKKTTWKKTGRVLGISYLGNLIAGTTFAFLCHYCGVLSGGAADLAATTLVKKTSLAFGPVFVKAFLCNWLVCMAVYLSLQSRDMTGKYLSILLPVSTFIAIGFEHSVANMFFIPAGLLCSTGITLKTCFFKNIIPATLGNVVSGALMNGALMSFMFGRLGEGK